MRFVIAGNDLRSVALARVLRREGHDVVVVPRARARPGEEKWQAVRATGLVDEVIAAEPEAVVCLHVESSDAGIVDRLREALPRLPVFGVSAAAARVETSRAFGLEIAQAAGLRVPRSDSPPRFPCVVKYCGLLGGRGSRFASNRAELERALRELPPGDVIVQEFIGGDELALSLLVTSGDARLLNVNFEYKRRFDGDRGENTYGMGTVARNAAGLPFPHALLDGTVAALQSIGYCGPVDINFIVDPETGQATFLELTARFGDPELSSEILLLDGVGEMLLSVARDGPIAVRARKDVWAMGVVATGGRAADHAGVVVDRFDDASTDDLYFSAAGDSLESVRVSIARAIARSGASPYRSDIGHDAERRWRTYERWFATARPAAPPASAGPAGRSRSGG